MTKASLFALLGALVLFSGPTVSFAQSRASTPQLGFTFLQLAPESLPSQSPSDVLGKFDGARVDLQARGNERDNSCRPPAWFSIIFEDSFYEVCGEPKRPLPPCPPNNQLYWDDCVGSYTYTASGNSNGRKVIARQAPPDAVTLESVLTVNRAQRERGRYTGEWRLNKPHFVGEFVDEKGEKYKGEFFLGVFHGTGTLTFRDGTQYKGEFFDGERTGIASQTYKTGDKYTGNFVGGRRNGRGLLVYADGRVYQGQFLADKLNGIGRLALPNGDYYEGNFANNTIAGEGTLTFADGRQYVGGWRNNLRHGKGVLYGADGKVLLDGEWKDGDFVRAAVEKQ
jgi:hypothetical protein